ncbi:lysophospholipid acyltransferase 1-like protein [Tanacetum coccineum]
MEDVCLLDSLGIIYLTKDSRKASRKVPRAIGQEHVKVSSDNSDGLVVIQAQLNNLGREIKKVNEKVYAAQVEYAGIPSKWRIRFHQYSVLSQQKEDMMTFTKFNRATVLFHGCLREYSYDMEEIKARMNSHCSAILNDALPQKEKDPGSFTLPCYINNMSFNKALADLGGSVSAMPYSTFTNLGLGELAPTKLIVELVDRTMKRVGKYKSKGQRTAK